MYYTQRVGRLDIPSANYHVMLCILYVLLLSTWLGIIGLIAEQAIPSRLPKRWIWCVTIAASLIVPPLFKARHSVPMRELLEQDGARTMLGSLSALFGGVSSSLPDAQWWATSPPFEALINPVWLFASACVLLWGLFHSARASWLVQQERSSHEPNCGPSVLSGVPVVVSKGFGPATVGLWAASIVVPTWVLALPEPQRGFVLRHEGEHRAARDPLLLFVTSLAFVLTPWNLALLWQMRRLRLAVELDCDARVVRALGDSTTYASFLLSVAEATAPDRRLQPSFIGGSGSLERRLRSLLARPKHWAVTFVVAPVLTLALLGLALAMPHPVSDSHARRARHSLLTGPPTLRTHAHMEPLVKHPPRACDPQPAMSLLQPTCRSRAPLMSQPDEPESSSRSEGDGFFLLRS